MSEKFGLMALENVQDRYLSGHTVLNCGQETATEIDKEVMRILKEAYEKSICIEITGKKQTNTLAFEFFSEFSTCNAQRINLRLLDTASGTLVGLGLLGTFLGLTIGKYINKHFEKYSYIIGTILLFILGILFICKSF